MSKHILVIDDAPDDLKSMEEMLKGEGYRVETAANWDVALEKIHRAPFDLILLDILMPESGYNILKRLRKKLGIKSKIAYVTIVPRVDVNLEGINGIIQKPFNYTDFVTMVGSLIQ